MPGRTETRTLIVHNNGIFGSGLCALLESDGAIQIVGARTDRVEALNAVRPLRPDLVLIEATSDQGGSDPEKFLKQMGPSGRVITLSADSSNATVFERSKPGRVTRLSSMAALVQLIKGPLARPAT